MASVTILMTRWISHRVWWANNGYIDQLLPHQLWYLSVLPVSIQNSSFFEFIDIPHFSRNVEFIFSLLLITLYIGMGGAHKLKHTPGSYKAQYESLARKNKTPQPTLEHSNQFVSVISKTGLTPESELKSVLATLL